MSRLSFEKAFEVFLKSWVLGIREDILKGIAKFTINLPSRTVELVYSLQISKEFTRKGHLLIGVLAINLKRRLKEDGNEEHKKFPRYIINLGAFLRSIGSEREVDHLKILGDLFISQGVSDIIIPLYFLPELKERIKPILNDVILDFREIVGDEEYEIVNIDLRVTSKRSGIKSTEILADLMKMVISQYIDISELHLLRRNFRRIYGFPDEELEKYILKRWKNTLNEIINLVINYMQILAMSKMFDKVEFLNALGRSLTPHKVKLVLSKFTNLAKQNVDGDTYQTYLTILKEIVKGTTLEGFMVEGFDGDIDEKLVSSAFFDEISPLIKPNLEDFSRNLNKIIGILRKVSRPEEALESLTRMLFTRHDLSEDDKIILAIIISLIIKPSAIKNILRRLRSLSLCDACPGSKIIHLLLLALSRPRYELLEKISGLIMQLIYSDELEIDTYKYYLILAYAVKARIAKQLGLNNITTACIRTMKLLSRSFKISSEIFERVVNW